MLFISGHVLTIVIPLLIMILGLLIVILGLLYPLCNRCRNTQEQEQTNSTSTTNRWNVSPAYLATSVCNSVWSGISHMYESVKSVRARRRRSVGSYFQHEAQRLLNSDTDDNEEHSNSGNDEDGQVPITPYDSNDIRTTSENGEGNRDSDPDEAARQTAMTLYGANGRITKRVSEDDEKSPDTDAERETGTPPYGYTPCKVYNDSVRSVNTYMSITESDDYVPDSENK